jgi:hypothetical protein
LIEQSIKVAAGVNTFVPITIGVGFLDVALFYYIRRIVSICKGVKTEKLATSVEKHGYSLLASMLVIIF